MTQYHAKRRIFLSASMCAIIAQCVHAFAGPAIGNGQMFANYCPPSFMKGAGVLGSMGINGVGGVSAGFRPDTQTLCVKPPQQIVGGILTTQDPKISAIVRQANSMQAMKALLKLQETDCKTGKISPKAQACFLYKSIAKKAKSPRHTISVKNNALFISGKNKVDMMIVIERFGNLVAKRELKPNLETVLGPQNYKVSFNEFDDILKKEGRLVTMKRHNKCQACLESLKLTMNADTDCACEDNLSISLEDLKSTE